MSAQLQETPESIEERYLEAARHHSAGRTREAEHLYREILRVDARHSPSLHLLGVIATDSGRYTEALELIGQSLEIAPYRAGAHQSRGIALVRLQRFTEAIAAYRKSLQLDSGLAETHYNLGNALWETGELDAAIAAYRRAVELEPDFAGAHYNLANALWRAGRADEAVVHYNRTLELQPGHGNAYINLGNALLDLGRFEEALARYDTAANLRKPESVLALENQAQLLMQLGRTTESLRAAGQALTLNPRSARSWYVRAWQKPFAPEDPDIGAMEQLLAAAQSDGASLADRIHLHFALGTAWLKAGEAERAFAHVERGNRLKRSTLTYDAAATAGWMARIAECFTPQLLKRLSHTGHPSEAPLFVIGMPRSGTTLVEQILASHPHVQGLGELSLVQDLVTDMARSASEPSLDYPELLARLVPADMARLGGDYVQHVAFRASGRPRMVDKEPLNFLYAGLIHLMLPNARIIHCRRDPVDTCLSCYTNLFLSDLGFVCDLGELGLYYRCYEALTAHWRALLPPERFIEIHYEDVVNGLEREARRLLDFCGLEWTEACLEFYATSRAVRTVSCVQVRQPIYRDSVGRWKSYARYLGPLLTALGVE